MRRFFSKPRYSLASHVVLWSSLIHVLSPNCCYTQSAHSPFIAAAIGETTKSSSDEDEPKYTVNFNDTSVIEVIRFVSKITGTNFVFSENDLQFKVSIVSEEPISAKNFTSALIQVLRVNGLNILEQDGNFLITQAASGVNQLPTIVSGEIPDSKETAAPIITRVFRVNNASLSNLVGIIKPMTSAASQIEVSEQTKQLIITDVTTNVDKIAQLLLSLDTPHSNLEIETFVAKYVYLPEIIRLTEKIMAPFLEGTPLLFIPQLGNNTIFVVSTPHMIERAFSIMEDIDILPSEDQITDGSPSSPTHAVHVYKILELPAEELLSQLQTIAKQLPKGASPLLTKAIEQAKYLKKTNSIVFTADDETWKEIEKILKVLDDAAGPKEARSLWLYKMKYNRSKEVLATLKEMASTIESKSLRETLESAKYIPETNSIVFHGSQDALDKLKQILPTVDLPEGQAPETSVFAYRVLHLPIDQIVIALHEMVDSFHDPALNDAIDSMKWSDTSDSILFHGTNSAIQKLKVILPAIDSSHSDSKNLQLYMYRVVNTPVPKLEKSLKKLIGSIDNKELIAALKNMERVDGSDTLIFKGTRSAIEQLEKILPTIDVAEASAEVFSYRIKSSKPEALIKELEQVIENSKNKELIEIVDEKTWIPANKTLIFHGPASAINKLRGILPSLEEDETASSQKSNFLIYHPKNLSGKELSESVEDFAKKIKGSGLKDKNLLEVIDSMKWVESSKSLVFTGEPASLDKVKAVLEDLDVAPMTLADESGINQKGNFLVYHPKHLSGQELAKSLEDFAKNLKGSGLKDKDILEAIDSMKWVESSHSLVFTGKTASLSKIEAVLADFDIPKKVKPDLEHKAEFLVYHPKHLSGPEIAKNLEDFAKNLKGSGLQDKNLLAAIDSMKWVASSQTLVFTGGKESLGKLEVMIKDIDTLAPVPEKIEVEPTGTFLVYHPKHLSGPELVKNMADFAKNLKGSGLKDKNILEAIDSMKWVASSKTLVFTGTVASLNRIEAVLTDFDVPEQVHLEQKAEFLVYHPKHLSGQEIAKSLDDFAKNLRGSGLEDKNILAAIDSMKWVASSKSLVFTGSASSLNKISVMLKDIDTLAPVPEKIETTPKGTFLIYHPKHLPGQELIKTIEDFAKNFKTSGLQDKNLLSAIESVKWVSSSKSIVFTGEVNSLKKIEAILQDLDIPEMAHAKASEQKDNFFVYHPKNLSGPELAKDLEEFAKNLKGSGLQDKGVLDAIDSMKWIASSKSLVFTGASASLNKIEVMLKDLDTPKTDTIEDVGIDQKDKFLIYHPKYQVGSALAKELNEFAKNLKGSGLKDKNVLAAIDSMKWVSSSHSLVFTGTAAALDRIETVLKDLDVPVTTASDETPAGQKDHFLVYHPKFQVGPELAKNLEEFAKNLKGSGLRDKNILDAIDSMKWVDSSNSLIFTGEPASLNRIEAMLKDLDTLTTTTSDLFLYKPRYATKNQLQEALTNYAQNLDPAISADQALAKAIYLMEWMPDSSSFRFQGSPETLGKLKGVLASIDTPKGLAGTYSDTFFLYKLQNAPGNVVIQHLKELSDNLPPDDANSASIIKALNTLKWVKESNGILITGSNYAIEQVKTLIAEFDTTAKSATPIISPKADFYIYKRLHQSPEYLQKELQDLGKDLSASSLADEDLIHTLETVRVVSATNSLLFTGTPEAITKVKKLLPTIDTKVIDDNAIQTIGNTVFFIYKIKRASPEELMQALKTFGTQLGNTGLDDRELEISLDSVQWVKETNSLLFTGSKETLEKVEPLAEKFDLESMQAPTDGSKGAATFVVYSPKYQEGTSLISILHEFMQNLMTSGVSNPPLFETITNLKYIPKTNSLVISGDAASVKQVEALMERFDIANIEEEATISSVESTSFLVYKLQYHLGLDLISSLKNTVLSLYNSAPTANKSLVDAVDSLQWVEVTNSILGTGTPEVLSQIKELIASLDAPLRQVFIEVLVIETSLFNTQNFGLQWGTQLQYLNKTIGAMGNFPTTLINNQQGGAGNTPPGTINFANPLSYTTNLNTPVQGNSQLVNTAVPFSTGFDLGVIGDLIFHKGKSFLSLGNLLNALQTDNDTTVVMNPKIITQDGRTSNIFVGQNIPFIGSFISNSASNTISTSNIEYRDVGVNLTITPTLGTNNIVTLEVKQDISEQQSGANIRIQGAQVTGIQTSHTTMNTRVHVPDRHFLVLSGMIQDTKKHFRSSIPCLGGLPVIGALFAENDRADTRSNVIIFLRPFIIDSFEEYDRLTAAEEDLYKEQAAPQDLKEQFDAGMEMIKNLNND